MKYSPDDIRALTTWQAAVLIPGLQAGVSGALVGIIAGTLAWIAGADALKWGLLSGAVAGLLAFWAGVADWREAVYRATRNQAEPRQAETVRLEVLDLDNPNQSWGAWLNLPVEPGAAKQALTMLAEGKDLSISSSSGKGNPLSRTEFVTLRDALINAGLAAWNNPRSHAQGCSLSVGGRAVLRRYADRLPAPPPAGNRGETKVITG